MKQKLFKSMALVAILMFGIFLLTPSLRSQEKSGRSSWTWNNSDGGQRIEVKVENKVEFNEDYSDVSAVADDGAKCRLDGCRFQATAFQRNYSTEG